MPEPARPFGPPGWGRPRSRPPWWPEGEAWPPAGPAAWGGMRRHLIRRVGLVLLGMFVLVFGASALAVALFVRTSGRHPVAAALTGGLVLMGFAALIVGRAVRRLAVPLAEVMEA